MKKSTEKEPDDDLRPEYDLTKLKGEVRGKYVQRFEEGTNVVFLTPDVARYSPNDEAVNTALKSLIHARCDSSRFKSWLERFFEWKQNGMKGSKPDDDKVPADLIRQYQGLDIASYGPNYDPNAIPLELKNGRYILNPDKRCGRGGQGSVYEGYDTMLDDRVAVKLVDLRKHSVTGFMRLLHEAQITRNALRSARCVVQVHDIGVAGWWGVIVMELMDASLADDMNHKNISRDKAVETIVQIAKILQSVHDQGILHCDIKPHNILRRNRNLFIGDFGMAVTMDELEEGKALGCTYKYAAPEWFTGECLDPRSDVYSLGVLLYQLLCGTLPFDADSPGEILAKIMREKPAALDSIKHKKLKAIVLQAIHKHPDKRFQSASEMAKHLQEWKKGQLIDRPRDYAVRPGIIRWAPRLGKKLLEKYFAQRGVPFIHIPNIQPALPRQLTNGEVYLKTLVDISLAASPAHQQKANLENIYREWLSKNPFVFKLIQANSEQPADPLMPLSANDVVGFTCVIPLTKTAYDDYRDGRLSEWDFAPHIEKYNENQPAKHLCIQAVTLQWACWMDCWFNQQAFRPEIQALWTTLIRHLAVFNPVPLLADCKPKLIADANPRGEPMLVRTYFQRLKCRTVDDRPRYEMDIKNALLGKNVDEPTKQWGKAIAGLMTRSGIYDILREELRDVLRQAQVCLIEGLFSDVEIQNLATAALNVTVVTCNSIDLTSCENRIESARKRLRRNINVAVYKANEFAKRLKKEPSLQIALEKRHYPFLLGDEDTLQKITGH